MEVAIPAAFHCFWVCFTFVFGFVLLLVNFLFKNDPQAYDLEIKEISYIIVNKTCLHNSRNELIHS